MKNITKLFLLAALVVFASCQNETLSENDPATNNTLTPEEELVLEDKILASDGEEDESLIIEQDLEEEIPAQEVTFSLSSKSTANKSCTPDIEGLELSLPSTIEGETTAKPGVDSYFDLTLTGDSVLTGTALPAWCVDVAGSLNVESDLVFDVYSSYSDIDSIPTNRIDKPQNFDKINWIVNQSFIGQTSPSGGVYTFGDVQWAIWDIIDDSNCNSCTYLGDDWSTTKGQEIADAALANGEGFVPSCGQQLAIVLVPNDNKQSIIITKEVQPVVEPCSDCEGSITKLELEFDWKQAKKVDFIQRKENTYYGSRIYCNRNTQPGEKIVLSGTNSDGTFGKYIYIFINNRYYTKIKTNCDVNIGPGYFRGVFNVISGESSNGGELCEYVKTDNDNSCIRYW